MVEQAVEEAGSPTSLVWYWTAMAAFRFTLAFAWSVLRAGVGDWVPEVSY